MVPSVTTSLVPACANQAGVAPSALGPALMDSGGQTVVITVVVALVLPATQPQGPASVLQANMDNTVPRLARVTAGAATVRMYVCATMVAPVTV